MAKHYFVIRELDTDKEVERIDVSEKSERSRERVERGLLRKVDTERFYVDEESA